MRSLLFRYRGLVLAVPAVLLLAVARPTTVWLLLGGSFSLAGESLRLWAIGYSGQPTRAQELTAPILITAGPYSLVRNPLYLGNLLTIVGVAFAALGSWSWLAPALLGCLAGLGYASIISLEEEFLGNRFGSEYQSYLQTVPALLPRSWRPKPGQGVFSRAAWKYETSSLVWLAVVWGVLLVQRGIW